MDQHRKENENFSSIYWIHALTPMHVGMGQGMGYIDLPVVREKVTGWPLIPGSTIKGVIRDRFRSDDGNTNDNSSQIFNTAFGRADNDGDDTGNAGSVVFTDARIVCLPVRSLYGTFAYVTCPMALQRLARDLEMVRGISYPIPEIPPADPAVTAEKSSSLLTHEGHVILEDLDLKIQEDKLADSWADLISGSIFLQDSSAKTHGSWADEFKKRFVIISDDIFNFLCETGTEVQTHIKIKENTKTVEQGALWTEESLPAETILAGPVWIEKIYRSKDNANSDTVISVNKIKEKYFSEKLTLRFGGKSSTGKGLARFFVANLKESGHGKK